jgi:hypothetical protein
MAEAEATPECRLYLMKFLDPAVSDSQLPTGASEADIERACDKIRDRLVLRAWEDLRFKDRRDFPFGELEAALWTEGYPYR